MSERRAGPRLTPRGALLLVVLFALAAAAVLPLRQHAQQGRRIAQLQARHQALERENARLELERQRLKDPAHVEQLARQDQHLVHPGEQAWVLTGPPPADPARPAPAPPPPPEPAWYERAWQRLTGWLR